MNNPLDKIVKRIAVVLLAPIGSILLNRILNLSISTASSSVSIRVGISKSL